MQQHGSRIFRLRDHDNKDTFDRTDQLQQSATPKTTTATGSSHPTQWHNLQPTTSAIRTARRQRASHTSAASVTSRTEHSQAHHRPMTSSAPILPAKRQPLQQHSFNAPAPATMSTAAAAAAAAALPPEPFRNPASINISPQQKEHQRQTEKQQQRTCITIEQPLQAASSTSNTTTETRRQRRPHLHCYHTAAATTGNFQRHQPTAITVIYRRQPARNH